MMKRLISLLLTAMLLLSLCSTAQAQEIRTNGAAFYNRTADASTLDSWKTLFGPDEPSTANVGTVWTDKTVTTTVPEYAAGQAYDFDMADDQTNFMVTLSTLSATMSITGHETLPTDTVFVLDLSSSMYRLSTLYSTDRVEPMVSAVNQAMHRLLELNPLNRVGIVIYYGRDTCSPESDQTHYVPLLELDTYEPRNSKDYIDMNLDSHSRLRGIVVNNDLTIRGTRTKENPNGIKATHKDYVMPGTTNGSYDNVAGTYIQLGLKQALEMMLAKSPTIPADSEFQAGATRIPIMVLMSDGEPTAADHEFAVMNQASMGANSTAERSPAGTDFLTQLTAGLVRELMDMHYAETEPLFYTLGLGEPEVISMNVMNPKVYDIDCQTEYPNADADNYSHLTKRASEFGNFVNSPGDVNAKIQEYWDELINNDVTRVYHCYYNGGFKPTYESYKDVYPITEYITNSDRYPNHKIAITYPTSVTQKYYVDKYFPANTASELTNAFNALVDEIILQSAYYPTYVENGAIGMSGYVDFHDEIGDMMEVKAVHGLARKANSREIEKGEASADTIFYYKGADFAKYVSNCTGDALTELRSIMTKLLQVRLGLRQADAQTMVGQIINPSNKMIYWTDKDHYSNAFSWYADADEKFIALAPNDNVVPSQESATPEGAVYKITSYWYASPYDLENTNSFIRIKRELATGKECVTWSVPASMIPLVTYQVELQYDRLSDPGQITVNYKDNYPMRAFFEVGLRSDVNKYNAVQVLKDAGYGLEDGVLLSDGVYHFFSNKWATRNEDDTYTIPQPQIENPDAANNTIAYFRPSEQNEHYFITTDSPLYIKNGTTYTDEVYTGTTDPSGKEDQYYVKVHEFYKEDNTWKLRWINVDLPDNFKAKQHAANQPWYVDSHTPRNPDTVEIEKKADGNIQANATASLPYSTIEKMDKGPDPENQQKQVDYSLSILGNNGTFHFTADTGIAITKHVTQVEGIQVDSGHVFTFVIEPAEGSGINLNGTTYAINYHKDGVQIPNSATSIKAVDGKITVQLKAGETAYLAGCVVKTGDLPGLPAGSYTVTELISGKEGEYFFEVDQVTVKHPGVTNTETHNAASIPVTMNRLEVTEVDYTNKPVKTGCIQISKAVNTDAGITAPEQVFTFEVTLDKERHAGKKLPTNHSVNGAGTIDVPAGGVFTVPLKAGETLTIYGIAAEQPVTVTVQEITLPTGFAVTVPADGEIVKTVTAGSTAEFSFTNKYTVSPASVALSGSKTLEGRTLAEGEFSFALTQTNGDHTETVRNNSNGEFSFTALTYTKPDTYTYTVKEVVPTENPLPGVAYDATVYTVTVTVTDNGTGQLAATTAITKADGTAANALAFTNTYDATDGGVNLSGKKTLVDAHTEQPIQLRGGEFTFALYPAAVDANGVWTITGDAIQSVTSLEGGGYAFTQLNYNAAGTYRYIVKECWDETNKRPGVTYDATEYHVTVVVTDDNATLTPVVEVVPPVSTFAAVRPEPVIVPQSGLNFTNTFTPAVITLSGTKLLSGREMTENDVFTFELYEANEQYEIAEGTQPLSAAINADGSFSFPEITFSAVGSYYYVVKEAPGTLPGVTYDETVYNIQVTVSAKDVTDGTTIQGSELVASVSGIPDNGLIFKNLYDATDAAAVFSGVKTLEGRPLQEGEFSFTMYAAEMTDTGIQIGEAIETVRNDAHGAFSFTKALDYTAAGTYYYIVREDAGTLPGVTYDQTEYHITIDVTDENAVLTPTVTVVAVMPVTTFAALPAGPLTVAVTDLNFTNHYDAQDTFIAFSGRKYLSGRSMDEGEFTFTLYEADTAYTPGAVLQTTFNTADGAFAFLPIPYDSTGVYYYVVREEQGPLTDMTYDDTEYRIQVIVTDTAEAKLTAAVTVTTKDPLPMGMEAPVADALFFHNVHDETDTAVLFSGTKTYAGHSLSQGEFTFTLYSADGSFSPVAPLQTAANTADGTFAFRPVVFSHAGTYHFVVREDQGGKSYVTYDGTEYRILVEVWNNNGALVANVTANRVSNGEFTSVNPTGELTFTNHYIPASVTVPFSGLKVYQGAALQSGMFTFHLYAADADFNPVGAPLDSAVNAVDGSFSFSRRAFHSAGVYRFLVVEDASLPLPNVSYDTTVYHLTVTVTDDGYGSLAASTSITTADGRTADMPVFENVYFEVPDTGDHSSPEALMALCLLSLTALLTLVIFSRRKARS